MPNTKNGHKNIGWSPYLVSTCTWLQTYILIYYFVFMHLPNSLHENTTKSIWTMSKPKAMTHQLPDPWKETGMNNDYSECLYALNGQTLLIVESIARYSNYINKKAVQHRHPATNFDASLSFVLIIGTKAN